ncbi:molybdopterin-dependent oxidoreductase [Paenirhodobacter populi]|uniref:molybdopterin-dependent oxidoreductase n=1 Tax=Paenirhodobacter populi TaxID=2306993 RepID=UPI000FE3EB20|nr:molybdopterin-dependent oxidoreductase [Sinirhodobacter populi]RWR04784.1 Asp-tRNA(Asn)/Glu-tRNA(Gln) amidotransferase GatCAB subunit C [Sinirhodobacter populi]
MNDAPFRFHSSHWGAFRARAQGAGLEIRPLDSDPDPSPIIHNLATALDHPARLGRPLVRRGWLADGPGPDDRRGSDSYVEMDWDRALDLAAGELARLGAGALPEAGPMPGAHVFGGSYGWSSAGRFHHAQGLLHRFLNSIFGGYVSSVNTYSSAAGEVVMEIVYGAASLMTKDAPYWDEIAEHSDMVLAFGGLPLRPMQVAPGGASAHVARAAMERAARRGCRFVCVSPLSDDLPDLPGARWIAPRPATDVALMLGMAWHLEEQDLVNRDYLARYTSGYDRFLPYLKGETDGIPKTPSWASAITGIPAATIRELAAQAAAGRTHVSVTYSLQRAENGEQPIWMALVLASMLGQGQLKGAGFTYSLGSMGDRGRRPLAVPLPRLPQGRNRVPDFIPVARISELLLHPGKAYTYKGETRHYADIRLVYWAGGNPFHHHQDLQRLTRAFARPDTIIVHDSVGTATAAHADIIFPATLTAEREDIGAAGNDPLMIPMQRLAPPFGEARDDYDIFAALARRLGCGEGYTEGLDSRGWQERIYRRTQEALARMGLPAPDFADFMRGGPVALPLSDTPSRMDRFHADPEGSALPTDSGRIEIFCPRIARAGLPGHPVWMEPEEWLGGALADRFPFQLVANQPQGKLHSQLDFGPVSMQTKRRGREVARMNPTDAARLGLAGGDTILLRNDRGGALAVLELSPRVRERVIQLSTGAWYAPRRLTPPGESREMTICVNGNPNILTSDRGASILSQGCAGQLTLVDVTKWTGEAPDPVPHRDILPRMPG